MRRNTGDGVLRKLVQLVRRSSSGGSGEVWQSARKTVSLISVIRGVLSFMSRVLRGTRRLRTAPARTKTDSVVVAVDLFEPKHPPVRASVRGLLYAACFVSRIAARC